MNPKFSSIIHLVGGIVAITIVTQVVANYLMKEGYQIKDGKLLLNSENDLQFDSEPFLKVQTQNKNQLC